MRCLSRISYGTPAGHVICSRKTLIKLIKLILAPLQHAPGSGEPRGAESANFARCCNNRINIFLALFYIMHGMLSIEIQQDFIYF